jgi:hypothetical protein
MASALKDPVDVENVNHYSASWHNCQKEHVPSHRWWDVSISHEDESMIGRLELCHEVGAAQVVQILHGSYS